MKKILIASIIITWAISLSGCIPAALMVGATASGAVIADQRNVKTIVGDRNRQLTALKLLMEDPDIHSQARVSVTVFNHFALLCGEVPNQDLKDRAYQLVSRVHGITRIYNQIVICPRLSFQEVSKDAWVTTRVKTALLTTKHLNSEQVKVVTEGGVVYLMGLVSQEQGELAANSARSVPGVKKVVKMFQYTS